LFALPVKMHQKQFCLHLETGNLPTIDNWRQYSDCNLRCSLPSVRSVVEHNYINTMQYNPISLRS